MEPSQTLMNPFHFFVLPSSRRTEQSSKRQDGVASANLYRIVYTKTFTPRTKNDLPIQHQCERISDYSRQQQSSANKKSQSHSGFVGVCRKQHHTRPIPRQPPKPPNQHPVRLQNILQLRTPRPLNHPLHRSRPRLSNLHILPRTPTAHPNRPHHLALNKNRHTTRQSAKPALIAILNTPTHAAGKISRRIVVRGGVTVASCCESFVYGDGDGS